MELANSQLLAAPHLLPLQKSRRGQSSMSVRDIHDQRDLPRVHRGRNLLSSQLRRLLPHDGQHPMHDAPTSDEKRDLTEHEQHAFLVRVPDDRTAVRHHPRLLPDDGEDWLALGQPRGALPAGALRRGQKDCRGKARSVHAALIYNLTRLILST